MYSDVRDYIRACEVCQKTRELANKPNPRLHVRSVEQPFDTVAIDTMGPLPADASGNAYIIVAIDPFTRYTELFAAPDATSRSAARAMLSLVGRYGAPRVFRSDQGTQFVSQMIDQLLELMGSGRDLATPYRPQSNGHVERANREILRHLRAIVYTDRVSESWSLYLPMVARVLNSTVSSATGTTPTRLLFAGAVDSDRHILNTPPVPERLLASFDAYVLDLADAQDAILEASARHQAAVNAAYLKHSPSPPSPAFRVGDKVLCRYVSRAPSKLHAPFEGPLLIIRCLRGDLYDVYNPANHKVKAVHASRLRKFVSAVNPVVGDDALLAQDQALYEIESIVDHKEGEKRKDWSFRVRWYGYDESEDTWEPFAKVKHADCLTEYLARTKTRLPRR